MKRENSDHFVDGKLPVFVFPTSLRFFADDQFSHKQVLTLYNPYDFNINFKVFCNNPRIYTVIDSEGIIKPKCCIDIVIRITEINLTSFQDDKFRIHISEVRTSEVLGKQDIPVQLLPHSSEAKLEREKIMKQRKQIENFMAMNQSGPPVADRHTPSIPVLLLSVICVIALMLPTNYDERIESFVPPYLHLSINQKLVAAYVLGLATMVLLRA